MLVDEYKGQRIQDVKKIIRQKMIDAVCDRLFSEGCFRNRAFSLLMDFIVLISNESVVEFGAIYKR